MLSTLDLKVLWRNVSSARGTRHPVAEGLDAFLNELPETYRLRLQNALTELQKGSDSNEHFDLVRWASGCTQETVQAIAKNGGIECTPSQLFFITIPLLDHKIEPATVLLHPTDHPGLISSMKLMIANSEKTAEPADLGDTRASHALVDAPVLQRGDAVEGPAPPGEEQRIRPTLRLYGSTAAHTLEIGTHRRASGFLNVNVVVIESAQSMQGGFDWDNKLSVQLTPEEMPEVIAVLLGILKEATFSNHGQDRNKTVIFRNQKDGIQIVTSLRSKSYSVPVKTSVVYYLLDLFCRAMSEGMPRRNPTDVIALVRGTFS